MIGVSATDEVVLDDRGVESRILPRNLALIAWDYYRKGTPMLLGHDYNNLIGWNQIFGIHIEPGIVRNLVSTKLVENNREFQLIVKKFNQFYNQKIKDNEEKIGELKNLIQNSLNNHEKPYAQECVYFFEPGLTNRVFPNLDNKYDKDGLVSLNELEPLDLGIYKIGKLCIFAHRFFRRSFHILNGINLPFLFQLKKISESIDNIKIRIDPDMVGLASTVAMYHEREYWWGPFFEDNLNSIKPGETKYVVGSQKSFTSLIRTDFNWQSKKDKNNFEAEELYIDPPSIKPPLDKIDYYGCRYVHSIFSENLKEVHFDGAVRLYTKDQLTKRINSNLSKAGRKTNYIKLWRLDGELAIPKWKRLLSDYYRDNYLVGEYLGGKDEVLETYKLEKNESSNGILNKDYFPKLQLLISFHPWEYNITQERKIVSIHPLNQNINENFLNILDKNKVPYEISSKLGINREYKEQIRVPLIIHDQIDTSKLVYRTFEVIKEFLSNIKSNEIVKIFGLSISHKINNDEIRLSILGDINIIDEFLNNKIFELKFNKEDFLEWIDKISEYLNENYPKKKGFSDLIPKLNIQGIL